MAHDHGFLWVVRAAGALRESADVRIEDDCVSRSHCEISSINGTLWVRDLGSRDGIFVNGFNVPQSHLMPGDRLTVGMMGFRVEYDRQTQKRATISDAEAVAVT